MERPYHEMWPDIWPSGWSDFAASQARCFKGPARNERDRSQNVKSWVGGLPTIDSSQWPRDRDSVPMHFLAQIHTNLIRENCAGSDRFLPSGGALCFFADTGRDSFLEGAIRFVEDPDHKSFCEPPDDAPLVSDGQLKYEFRKLPEFAKRQFFPSYSIQAKPSEGDPPNEFVWADREPTWHYLFGRSPDPQGDGHYGKLKVRKPCHVMTFNNDSELGWHFGCFMFFVAFEDLNPEGLQRAQAFMVYG